MKKTACFFASRRYWIDQEELLSAYERLSKNMNEYVDECLLIQDSEEVQLLSEGNCLISIPMSGGVQPLIIDAVKKCKTTIIYAMYVKGNADADICDLMLKKNAAPTVMDTWGVVKREHSHSAIATDQKMLKKKIEIYDAFNNVQDSTLLLIGNTEPWVVSNSKNILSYNKLGINIKKIDQKEVAELYRTLTDDDAKKYYNYFKGDEEEIIEPTDTDIMNSARMAAALVNITEKYNADGIAIACFNLLDEGTTMCLGVSYINDQTSKIAACEGDLDSAVTMLIMKNLTSSKLWMANPGIHPNGVINFSHCTAPLDIYNKGKCTYILRNHHESGIGTSLQVKYPIGVTVTACRISDEAEKITINTGITIEGKYESGCRTQAYIKFYDYNHYLNSALGCHQVFAFEDIEEDMALLANELKLEII